MVSRGCVPKRETRQAGDDGRCGVHPRKRFRWSSVAFESAAQRLGTSACPRPSPSATGRIPSRCRGRCTADA